MVVNQTSMENISTWCLLEYHPLDKVSQFHNGVAAVAFSFVSIFVVLTNCFVLGGVCKMRQWRVKSMRLFLLLILSDITIGMVTLPLHVSLFISASFSHGANCQFLYTLNFFKIFPVILSELGVLLIAIDRYFAVLKRRIHTQYFTNRGISLVILLAVILSFIWGLVNADVLKIKFTEFRHTILLIVLGLFKTFIFVSVGCIYYTTLKSVQKTAKTTRQSFINQISTPPMYDRALYRISMLITVSFILCYLPSTVANFHRAAYIFLHHHSKTETLTYVEIWTTLPMYFTSGINGALLIYGNRKLKRWFKKLFECVPRVSPESPSRRVRRHAIIVGPAETKNIQKVIIAFNAS